MTKIVLTSLLVAVVVGCRPSIGGHTTEVENDSISMQQSDVRVDTIASFFGHKVILNDKVYQQLEKIANGDEYLSVERKGDLLVLKTGKVAWGINRSANGIALFSSVQPEDEDMRDVVKHLKAIYGEPYEDDDYDIKWSSSGKEDVFAPGSTLVYLRRVHSDEGGTVLFF